MIEELWIRRFPLLILALQSPPLAIAPLACIDEMVVVHL